MVSAVSSEQTDYVNNYLLLTKRVVHRYRTDVADWAGEYEMIEKRGHVTCESGLKLSIQASDGHYCSPKSNTGPYSSVEIMLMQAPPRSWDEFADSSDSAVFGWVPVHLVNDLIEANGGISSLT